MKAWLIYLVIGITALLFQSTSAAMSKSMDSAMHDHRMTQSVTAGEHPMSADRDGAVCCQQDCHCDMSLCHAGIMLTARLRAIFSASHALQITGLVSPALAAYNSPPFRPPIH